jgi:hypothetical protein
VGWGERQEPSHGRTDLSHQPPKEVGANRTDNRDHRPRRRPGHRLGRTPVRTDVPDTNIFHGDITWLADNDITRGCNPPTNTLFCPKDNVTREQMAAFMRRNAQTFGTAGFAEIETVALGGFPSNVEVATVTVDPKATAGVVLNTSVAIRRSGGFNCLAQHQGRQLHRVPTRIR